MFQCFNVQNSMFLAENIFQNFEKLFSNFEIYEKLFKISAGFWLWNKKIQNSAKKFWYFKNYLRKYSRLSIHFEFLRAEKK